MKKIILFFLVVCSSVSVLILISCTKKDNHTSRVTTQGLVGLSMLLNQNSSPGLAGYLDGVNYAHSIGINLFGISAEWTKLETSPYQFSLQDNILNPLTLPDPDNTKLKSYILVLKMIDTNRKIVPADIASRSFDDTVLINRFLGLIDAIAALSPVEKISHILIGNEVDAYLGAHPSELNSFKNFYQQAVDHIHQKMPWMKVGTIITYNSLLTDPAIFDNLVQRSDFACYTYYPTDESNPHWQMRPPAAMRNDFDLMAQKAGTKPFAFTEIGYPSSTENNSSELLQQQFVENMFADLQPYKDDGKLAFIFYHGLYDYPPQFCEEYAQQQGIEPGYLCGFMNSLGLRNYISGKAKLALDAFIQKMKTW